LNTSRSLELREVSTPKTSLKFSASVIILFKTAGPVDGWLAVSVRNASHRFLTSALRHTSENAAGKQKIDRASCS